MLNGLSLFSGIGGIELGLSEWVTTKAYCEIDPYAQAVLKSRMADTAGLRHLDSQAAKHSTEGGFSPQREPGSRCLDPAPIFPDITKLTAADLPHPIDIITGGFPCQDISNAGKRAGIQGKRSGLWFEMHRLIGELRPRYVFVENVSALLNRGLPEVLASLAEVGYDAIWTSIRASDVGAPHRRERVFILAYPNSQRRWLCGGAQQEQSDILPEVGEAKEGEQPGGRWQHRVKQVCKANVADAPGVGGQRPKPEGSGRGQSKVSAGNRSRGKEVANSNIQGDVLYPRVSETRGYSRMADNGRPASPWAYDPADLPNETQCGMGELVDGLPTRLDCCGYGYTPRVISEQAWRKERIKALGNAVVPQQAHEAFIRLLQLKQEIRK